MRNPYTNLRSTSHEGRSSPAALRDLRHTKYSMLASRFSTMIGPSALFWAVLRWLGLRNGPSYTPLNVETHTLLLWAGG
ncbi:hypothetical protein DM02DRAFT_615294 [Periconia macrospinosa]|uniref:Uncharacterized protein n=1 Tax=Periconia macrospinosa TaxID=97972 RepID=A0A2V1DLQ1_9PLEO|nr:hypothetical protein DM02DRAFT_615294 [Periconia macrospinosa]